MNPRILIHADADCLIKVDGVASGAFAAGETKAIPTDLGHHLVEAVSGVDRWSKEVDLTSTPQAVVDIKLTKTRQLRVNEEQHQKLQLEFTQEEGIARSHGVTCSQASVGATPTPNSVQGGKPSNITALTDSLKSLNVMMAQPHCNRAGQLKQVIDRLTREDDLLRQELK